MMNNQYIKVKKSQMPIGNKSSNIHEIMKTPVRSQASSRPTSQMGNKLKLKLKKTDVFTLGKPSEIK